MSYQGLMRDLPAEEYHAVLAMSAGGLKRMQQSPAHFYGLTLDPARPAQEPSAAMRNGTLVHCALFEPDAVATRYVVKPAGHDGRTKEGRAWTAGISQSVQVIDFAQMAAATLQAVAIRRLPEIGALLSDGYAEASAFWTDEATGELCKCRPDWVSPAGDGVILVDGKTCVDASPDGFAKAIWNYGYHLQAAWYSDGFEKATGQRVHGFVFAAVENTWPYAAAAYMLGDDALDQAREKNERLLELYAKCKKNGVWPGYAETIQPIALPTWAR
jgi:exodeoxyribonuclease VIII